MIAPDFSATYGIFDMNMKPTKITDVTNIIAEKFQSDAIITIPSYLNFKQHFGDHVIGQRIFLQLQVRDRKYNIIEDNYCLDLKINLNDTKKQINIVYYAYINRSSNWKAILCGQLSQLKSYGILDEANLYIPITDTLNIFEDVITTIKQIHQDVIISRFTDNKFEYPGIKLAYDLALLDPDSIIIYLHTKGISYNIQSRTQVEMTLMRATFENWRKKIESFSDQKINKIGLFPADHDPEVVKNFATKGGWMWFNFWYARGKYLIDSCEKPKISNNRWYYEIWLGGPYDGSPLNNDCYSLYSNQPTYFNVVEMEARLANLLKGM